MKFFERFRKMVSRHGSDISDGCGSSNGCGSSDGCGSRDDLFFCI